MTSYCKSQNNVQLFFQVIQDSIHVEITEPSKLFVLNNLSQQLFFTDCFFKYNFQVCSSSVNFNCL